MGRRYRLSEKTKRFFLITLLLTPACYQIMPEIRMALMLAAMGEAVLSADRIWARNESKHEEKLKKGRANETKVS